MPWVETISPNFAARHSLDDDHDVSSVLELLEDTRDRLAGLFPAVPGEVSVVIHPSDAALTLAQPQLVALRRLTAPAARRYLVGWFGDREIHVLAPRLLAAHASNVPGSREMNLLSPAALYTQVVVGLNNRWAWLALGAGQFFSGQTPHARPAIGRRLREGPDPSFPPGVRDAQLLGGTVFDLLAREEGVAACVELVLELPRGGAREALRNAFRGRSLAHTEGTWRAQLARGGASR